MDIEKKKDILGRIKNFLDDGYTQIELNVMEEGFSIIPTKITSKETNG